MSLRKSAAAALALLAVGVVLVGHARAESCSYHFERTSYRLSAGEHLSTVFYACSLYAYHSTTWTFYMGPAGPQYVYYWQPNLTSLSIAGPIDLPANTSVPIIVDVNLPSNLSGKFVGGVAWQGLAETETGTFFRPYYHSAATVGDFEILQKTPGLPPATLVAVAAVVAYGMNRLRR